MAANIIKGGHKVKGFDISEKLINAHVANDGIAANSPLMQLMIVTFSLQCCRTQNM